MSQMDDQSSGVIWSYRLPWWKQGILLLFSMVIVALVLMLCLWSVTRLPWIIAVVFALEWMFIAGLLIWLLLLQPLRVIASIACKPGNIEIKTLFGKKIIVPWQGLLQLKRLRAGMAYLDTYKDSYYLVLFPRSKLAEFVVLMHESSDARIIRFE